MKKSILLSMALLLGMTSLAWAHDDQHDKTPTPTPYQEGYIGVGGGVDLMGSNWNSSAVSYTYGGVVDVFGGYQFDRSLALQAEVENFLTEGTYSVNNIISQYNLRGLIELKYTIDSPICQPYLLAGGGLVYSLLNQPTNGLGIGYTTSVNADALGGIGVQVALSSYSHLFIQAKYNLVISSATSLQDVPITMGIWSGL